MTDASSRITETNNANDVVLYMKGTKSMPQCGFSSAAGLYPEKTMTPNPVLWHWMARPARAPD